MLRGVTGLQRKLLSLAEATAGPRRVLLLDNPAAGLDAESELAYFTILQRAVQHLPVRVGIERSANNTHAQNIEDSVIMLRISDNESLTFSDNACQTNDNCYDQRKPWVGALYTDVVRYPHS